jgi:beta-phosphoglucomutase-like phosphatase (HAD superfamily)
LGLKVGLASSSSCSWVNGHLERLGLRNYFDILRASDDVQCTKPDPDLYLAALGALGVRVDQAFAIEDSPNGALAAKRAGLFCVAVPNELTRRLSLDHADLRLESLTDMPFERLVQEIERRLDGKIY